MKQIQKYSTSIVVSLYALLAILTIALFNGTGGGGDSIHHFLFAKYAPDHPELFFDHWAKPLFVLLSSPFAQFGFLGMKIFNGLTGLFTVFFTIRIANQLGLKNDWLAGILIIFSPLSFALTFSGLTEPLFAFFLAMSVFFILNEKWTLAIVLASFLPFIRSEGLIILGVFGFYLLLQKRWKLLPWLLAGHIVYSIAGYFVYEDILWVFTKIPYARMDSAYGSGDLFHFARQLNYILGVPIFTLFLLGIIGTIVRWIRGSARSELTILIFLGFLAFFVAHSLFWYLGIFNSMGLIRVLIGVIPFIAIIGLLGYNTLTEDLVGRWPKVKTGLQILLVIYILIFPFSSNPAAMNWEKDLMLSRDQQLSHEVANEIEEKFGRDHRFILAHPYLSFALDIDHFDSEQRVALSPDYQSYLKSGDILIWDQWFSVVEQGIQKDQLDAQSNLIMHYHVAEDDKGRQLGYAVYEVK